MLTRDNIVAYHAKDSLTASTQKVGIELELFCVDSNTLQRVPFYSDGNLVSVRKIFEYLETYEGYTNLEKAKTFGLKKGESKITTEPGGQLEFSSAAHHRITDLLEEFGAFVATLQRLSRKLPVSWLDVAYFPVEKASSFSFFQSPRYEIIDRCWQQTGHLGRELMCNTASLQVSFDYSTVSDLEAKVNRSLLVQPILSFITANSKFRESIKTYYRSFRSITYKDTDSTRMGMPGLDDMWMRDKWTLDDYIVKVLKAPTYFNFGEGKYTESSHEPFEDKINEATFEDYFDHLTTIYTDIRVRNYFEVRYMDNPGIGLVPGTVILLHSLIYDDTVWDDFQKHIPYAFSDLPEITDLLNSVSKTSDLYWECKLLQPVRNLILQLQNYLEPALSKYLDSILNRVVNYNKHDLLPDLNNNEHIISHYLSSILY